MGKERWASWILAGIVLLIGGIQVAREWGGGAAPSTKPPGNPQWTPPPDIDRSGWTLSYEWPTDRLDRIEIASVREVHQDGRVRDYDGKLTLWFGPGARSDWPVHGSVIAEPHPELLGILATTGSLGVEFRGHPRREIDVSWLRALTQPEILESDVGPQRTTGRVRNDSLVAMTVQVLAGWRDGARWRLDDGTANRVYLRLPPGGTAPFDLAYAAAAGGTLSPPMVRPIFGPTGDPAFDAQHPPAPAPSGG